MAVARWMSLLAPVVTLAHRRVDHLSFAEEWNQQRAGPEATQRRAQARLVEGADDLAEQGEDMRFALAHVQPTPAVYCMDVQGHLCLGIDSVVELGMAALVRRAEQRLERLRREHPQDHRGAALVRFLTIARQPSCCCIQRSKNGLAVCHKSRSGYSCRPSPSMLSKVFCSSTSCG